MYPNIVNEQIRITKQKDTIKNRVYLDIPFKDKKIARDLGALIDAHSVLWYCNVDNPNLKQLVESYSIQRKLTHIPPQDLILRDWIENIFDNPMPKEFLGSIIYSVYDILNNKYTTHIPGKVLQKFLSQNWINEEGTYFFPQIEMAILRKVAVIKTNPVQTMKKQMYQSFCTSLQQFEDTRSVCKYKAQVNFISLNSEERHQLCKHMVISNGSQQIQANNSVIQNIGIKANELNIKVTNINKAMNQLTKVRFRDNDEIANQFNNQCHMDMFEDYWVLHNDDRILIIEKKHFPNAYECSQLLRATLSPLYFNSSEEYKKYARIKANQLVRERNQILKAKCGIKMLVHAANKSINSRFFYHYFMQQVIEYLVWPEALTDYETCNQK